MNATQKGNPVELSAKVFKQASQFKRWGWKHSFVCYGLPLTKSRISVGLLLSPVVSTYQYAMWYQEQEKLSSKLTATSVGLFVMGSKVLQG